MRTHHRKGAQGTKPLQQQPRMYQQFINQYYYLNAYPAITYTSTKACTIKYVFKFFLNTSRDWEVLMERGSSFHSHGAATTKKKTYHPKNV